MGYSATMATEASRQERFAEMIEQHRRIIFKVASTYGYRQDDREDLAQEIATQLWFAFPGYDQARPFSTWMYRIALNVAISHVRRAVNQGNHAVPLDRDLHDIVDENPVDHESGEQIRALHRLMARLHTLDRALLLLYLEERSYREISQILGISETNVATKIGRLKQRIRKEL